ncbi:MAG: HEAT repeat domain-containing protein [Alphaproteobacteria bacterium]
MKAFIRIVFSALFLFTASDALACSCAGPGTVEKAFQDARSVFTARATVTKKTDNGHAQEYSLATDKVWKGEPAKNITWSLPRHGCAFWNFADGAEYLIYAQPSWEKEKPGEVEITICSRTKKLDDARIETRYLDALKDKGDAQKITDALPHLLLTEPEAQTRGEAAKLIGEMMQRQEKLPDNALQSLLAATQDKEDSVRQVVAGTLGMPANAGNEEVRKTLLPMVKDGRTMVRGAAISALGMVARANSEAFRAIADALKAERQNKDSDPKQYETLKYETMLYGYARALAETAKTEEEKAEVVDLLTPMIDEVSDPYSKVGVIQHLGFQKGLAKKSAPKLLSVLKATDHYHVKQYTLQALGDIGAAELQAEIEPYLKDDNCYVSMAVVTATYKMDKAGFNDFMRAKGVPELTLRFDKCAAEIGWGLQSIAPAGREMEPLIRGKYAAMPDGDWKKSTLKTLLETWAKSP